MPSRPAARLGRALAALALLAPAAGTARAQFVDPAGDFLATYTGPRNPDLDVLSLRFEFDGVSTFRFFSTSAGAGVTRATRLVLSRPSRPDDAFSYHSPPPL